MRRLDTPGRLQAWPGNFGAPFMIPDDWNFDHGNYLQIKAAARSGAAGGSAARAQLAGGGAGWQEAFRLGLNHRFR